MLISHFLATALCIVLVWAKSIPSKDIKPNVFILTDISNEPDDAESLVRMLLYSNEINVSGIVATTSYWLNDTIHDEDIYPILNAYEKVHPNLLKHSPSYPPASYFRKIVSTGYPVYGLAALKYEKISTGASKLIEAVDKTSPDETIWILVWGGAGVLAESLNEISKTRSTEEVENFIKKLRVYSISDQDDAGVWIRYRYPAIFYISSSHGFNQYSLSTWVGISGESYNRFEEGGPDSSYVAKDWLSKYIRHASPLGEAYPEYMFIMEGDTPSLLHVLPNGLNDPESPKHGGWGGRYDLIDISGQINHYADVTDDVLGKDGKWHCSNKATIWRWRDAYQNDFAGRMQWTVKSFNDANHAPIVIVNGSDSATPLELKVEAGTTVYLDASATYDLDKKDKLEFRWFHYRDVTATNSNTFKEVPEIAVSGNTTKVVSFKVPEFEKACIHHFGRYKGADHCKSYHIILEVTDSGSPPMRGYKRVILRTHPSFSDQKSREEPAGHDEL